MMMSTLVTLDVFLSGSPGACWITVGRVALAVATVSPGVMGISLT